MSLSVPLSVIVVVGRVGVIEVGTGEGLLTWLGGGDVEGRVKGRSSTAAVMLMRRVGGWVGLELELDWVICAAGCI